MANPGIAQGNLNRLIASVTYHTNPQLNVSASYLMPEGIDMTFEGQATTILPTMTGVVPSPEPYQMVRLTLHLIKSQGLPNIYKTQTETNTPVGDLTVRPDSTTLAPFTVNNASITGVSALTFSGRDAGYVISLVGSYNTNVEMWPD